MPMHDHDIIFKFISFQVSRHERHFLQKVGKNWEFSNFAMIILSHVRARLG